MLMPLAALYAGLACVGSAAGGFVASAGAGGPWCSAAPAVAGLAGLTQWWAGGRFGSGGFWDPFGIGGRGSIATLLLLRQSTTVRVLVAILKS